MKRLYQFAIVVASTALGTALGWGVLHWAGPILVQHFPLDPKPAKPAVNDFGNIILVLFNMGYYTGLTIGIGMTLAVLGGLILGVSLARRVGKPNRSLELKAA